MSRIYDSWEKLVGAVLRREKDRHLALCLSLSSFHSDVSAVSRGSGQRDVDPLDLSSRNPLFSGDVMSIEYEEIKKATKNFRLVLHGVGGPGLFYKGWIHEQYLTAVMPGTGIAVAVKILKHEGFQGNKEWLAEINHLGQLCHPNLIKLIGYNTDNRILVYEFMSKGSLDDHLFGGNNHFPWATRIKVAIGTARALAFLHGLEIPVMHRYFNCGEIFLDGDFNAKLSDFGLARDGPTGDETHVSTRVHGYTAPEYIATGRSTTRCGVYRFGVVFLELISGLRVLDQNRPRAMHNMIDWARPYLRDKKRLLQVVDRRLEGQYSLKEAYKVCKIGWQCISSDPKLRPSMTEVVAELEKLYNQNQTY